MNKTRIGIILSVVIVIVAGLLIGLLINQNKANQAADDKKAAKVAVESFYKELKNGNYNIVKTATTTDDAMLKGTPLMTDVQTGEPLSADEVRLVTALIKNATYTVNDVTLDKTVRSDKQPQMLINGTIVVSDLNELYYKDSVADLQKQAKSGAFHSQAETNQYATKYLWSAVENGTAAKKSQSFTLTVVKQADGSWKIVRDKGVGTIGYLLSANGGLEFAQWFNKA